MLGFRENRKVFPFLWVLSKQKGITVGLRTPTIHKLCHLLDHPSTLLSLRYIASKCCKSNERPFKVSYLMNTCGFSLESALLASKYLCFKTPDKPDAVINFFKSHGFSTIQISKLIKGNPLLLRFNPEKYLLPKLEFFYSKGMSRTDLAKALSANLGVLGRSLKDKIIPCHNFLKSVIHSDDKIINAMKRYPDILGNDYRSFLMPNIAILRENGVPESFILYLLSWQPRALVEKPDAFREVVEEVKQMGISPLRFNFVMAIHGERAMSKLTWERKLNVYRKWGWSEEEIISAFVKHPAFIMVSEDKIMTKMEFFVKKMGWESAHIARRPKLISSSLEKRIVPRCSVVQVLLSKGLINIPFSFAKLLESTEKLFLQKFVTCYEKEAPHLLKLYQEKMNLRLKSHTDTRK